MQKKLILVIFILTIVMVPSVAFGVTWPATGITSANTITMPSPYEPSGLAWNEATNKLFAVSDPTSDGNRITMMNPDGSGQVTWKMSGDFEALTIVDPYSNYIYVGVENPAAIKEFDLTSPVNSPRVTKTWNLNTWLGNLGNLGMEGLTYVPAEFSPFAVATHHAVFYAGLQRRPDLDHNTATEYDDGLIYAFDVNLDTSGDVQYLGYLDLDYSKIPVYDYNISDLYFSPETGTLFVLYDDSSNYLFELSADGTTVLNTYTGVPGDAREGIVIKTTPMSDTAEIIIAHDNNFTITRHFNFPVTLLGISQDPDSDGDGVIDELDCDPNNVNISSPRVFYTDADGDGLGFGLGESMCLVNPPAGYAVNSNDLNDNDYDNDGLETGVDCDDTQATVLGPQAYYNDADGDGLGYGTPQQSCALPDGFVSNNNDANDNDYDNDGVEIGNDCNDHDPQLGNLQTLYVDADGDGLGFGDGEGMCIAPGSMVSGYVTNHNDLNDHDYDNDGSETSYDCNDSDASIDTWQFYYHDADGDGLGILDESQMLCSYTPPAGYVANSNDANDNDHDNDGIEIGNDCNDHDPNIAGQQAYYIDADGDGLGYGQPQYSCSVPNGYVINANDANDNDYDNDGLETGVDCDDNQAAVLGPLTYYIDADGDGLGYGIAYQSCAIPNGFVSNNNDTNDDDYDNDGILTSLDCNDADANVSGPTTYYRDFDGDGFGFINDITQSCSAVPPEGYVTNHDDSDDYDADNDGKRGIDDCNDHNPSIAVAQRYYKDGDGDGLGSSDVAINICSYTVPSGYVTNSDDANDNDYDNDGIDFSVDCNDRDPNTWALVRYYQDADGDKLGWHRVYVDLCSPKTPEGYASNDDDPNDSDFDNDGTPTKSDCNDHDASISRNQVYYRDADGDGLGFSASRISVCSLTPPEGYVANHSDRNDKVYSNNDNDNDKKTIVRTDYSDRLSEFKSKLQNFFERLGFKR